MAREYTYDMIPEFDESGYSPAGIHAATLGEVEERFGRESEVRRVEFESLQWLVEIAERSGVLRLVINGSFVTDEPEPNDIVCVLLIGDDFPHEDDAEAELLAGLPFLQIDLVEQAGFDEFTTTVFASDRRGATKGMIEIVLRSGIN